MAHPKISAQEQRTLCNQAKVELERMEKILSEESVDELLKEFKNKFNICETVYKVILTEHQKRKGKKVDGYLKVSMTQVPHALAFAGYAFDKSLLQELFGASSKKGTTVKRLRDAVTHGIDQKAVNEIIMRKDELFGYMDSFLSEIRASDAVA